jgi:hypothetical protein
MRGSNAAAATALAREQVDPEDARILEQFGLDPAKWETAPCRKSRWDQACDLSCCR